MKILYLDTFSGISGDMFLGLCLDLGICLDDIVAALERLPLSGYHLAETRESRHGIEGVRLQVSIDEQHHHRTWTTIDGMLAESGLTHGSKDRARRIFRRLGEAEAKIHGVPVETVHFHEVGAVDSIVDVVGAAVALELLAVERVVCSPLPLSRGRSRCAHGVIPLPAPATLELLRGVPVIDGHCDRELVTPTGAAIAAESAEFGSFPAMTISRTGYGVGERDLADRPNLLRGLLGETAAVTGLETDRVIVLESHLDDSTPETLGYLMEQLFAAGALDVGYTPLQMKKNRPAVRLTLVSQPEQAAMLARLILHQSSATGVRCYDTQRFKLRRKAATVMTALGEARVKLLYDGDELLRITPEFESCRALAESHNRSLASVMHLVEQAAAATAALNAPD